jgi:Domain of unknown function (DUF4336)
MTGSMAPANTQSATSWRAITDGVWGMELLKRFPLGLRLPMRGTVVRLADGGLWVHSPTPPVPEVTAGVDALGPVRHLVGPSRMHHLSLGPWAARFPAAQLWAAPGLAAKRADLGGAGVIGGGAPPVWAREIEPLEIAGAPGIGEVVFFHRGSRTLICTDLLFNIRVPANRMTGLVLAVMGTKGCLAMSRVWRRYAKDRAALKASVEQMLSWDFARVIPAHGDVFEGEGGAVRDATRAALGWMLR